MPCISMFLALLLVEHHIKFYFVIKGMVNCKVLTSKKLLIGMAKSKFMNGAAVMTFLPQMARALRCVQREQLLISKIK
jgi:hypothetical protein